MKPKPRGNLKIVVIAIVSLILILGIVFGVSLMIKGGGNQEPGESVNTTNTSDEPSNVFNPEDDSAESDKSSTDQSDQESKDENAEESSTPEQNKDETSDQSVESPIEGTEQPTKPEQNSTQIEDSKMSVEKIWSGMRSSMGETLTANLALSKENLQELYGLDPAVCDEFILRKSGTVVSPEEYLIVKGSESNLSIVEQACQQRQAALAAQWEKVGKDYLSMIASYQIVRSGNYLFFGISPKISQLVGLFQGMMLSAG